VRRAGRLEWFTAQLTEFAGDNPVFHGFPTDHVPARVLRQFRARGDITDAEYRAMVRDVSTR
jgi:hypothetical protein